MRTPRCLAVVVVACGLGVAALGCQSTAAPSGAAAALPAPAAAVGADAPASTRPADLVPTEKYRTPFMFKEAALPDGYPAPGPLHEVIVKRYPPHRAARVDAGVPGGQDRMFNTLFDHIKRNDLAMTAPVEMGFAEAAVEPGGKRKTAGPQSMAFLYRSPALGTPGTDGPVEVVDLPAVTVASIAVRGAYDKKAFDRGMPKLEKWLADNAASVRAAGPPRFLGYNSPFVPNFWKLGEVQVPVEPVR